MPAAARLHCILRVKNSEIVAFALELCRWSTNFAVCWSFIPEHDKLPSNLRMILYHTQISIARTDKLDLPRNSEAPVPAAEILEEESKVH